MSSKWRSHKMNSFEIAWEIALMAETCQWRAVLEAAVEATLPTGTPSTNGQTVAKPTGSAAHPTGATKSGWVGSCMDRAKSPKTCWQHAPKPMKESPRGLLATSPSGLTHTSPNMPRARKWLRSANPGSCKLWKVRCSWPSSLKPGGGSGASSGGGIGGSGGRPGRGSARRALGALAACPRHTCTEKSHAFS